MWLRSSISQWHSPRYTILILVLRYRRSSSDRSHVAPSTPRRDSPVQSTSDISVYTELTRSVRRLRPVSGQVRDGTTLIAPTSAAVQVATTRSSTLLYARPAFLSIPLGSLGTVAVRGKAYEGWWNHMDMPHGHRRLDPTIASEG